MKTISAKELRDNLSDVLKRVSNGEEIEIIYRSRPIGRLVPKKKQVAGNGPAIVDSIKEMSIELKTHKSTLDPNKSYKELYHELMDNDPKYAGYVTKAKKT